MVFNLQNRIVVIVGASGVIGKDLCEKLSQEGARIIAVYNNNNEIRELEKKFGSLVEWYHADVTNSSEVKALCRYVLHKYKVIDALINCQGVTSDDLFITLKDEKWNSIIDTNLTSVFLCCKMFAKAMIKNGRGKIINFASTLANETECGISAYAASKAGLVALTKNVAMEIYKTGVSINAICPGRIISGLNSNSKNELCDSENSSLNLANVVSFIVYMLSDEFVGISGKVFDLKI